MNKDLTAPSWKGTMEKIRICHLSLIGTEKAGITEWKDAFNSLLSSIKDERQNYPEFAKEITELTSETGSTYDFSDIWEEYFNHLEENEAWDDVINSCDELMKTFKWESKYPSEYMYRKGNALLKLGSTQEARRFGDEWLEEYPNDLYAVASNVFLLITLGEIEKAWTLTNRHLSQDLRCDKNTDTFMMAAYRLYEITTDINAKQRIEEKISEYNKLSEKL